MGRVSELMQDVEELLFEGLSEQEIATQLNLSVEQVQEFVCMLEEADVDPYEWDDSDADADALASAGFGMDEDYSYDSY